MDGLRWAVFVRTVRRQETDSLSPCELLQGFKVSEMWLGSHELRECKTFKRAWTGSVKVLSMPGISMHSRKLLEDSY